MNINGKTSRPIEDKKKFDERALLLSTVKNTTYQ